MIGSSPPVEPEARELLALVHLQEGGCGEHVVVLVRGVGAMIILANELFRASVRKLRPAERRQVVEPVAVLQGLELGLEHEVEGGAEEAAELDDPLGEAADPEVDVVDAGGGQAIDIGGDAGAVEEGRAVGIVGDEVRSSRVPWLMTALPPSTSAVATACFSGRACPRLGLLRARYVP